MGLFSRRASAAGHATAGHMDTGPATPAPVNWADVENIRNEWRTQLESADDSMVAWRNGMRMYDDGPVPAQRLNTAEYMTRALGHQLFGRRLLTETDAAETVRRVLTMVELVPSEPIWLLDFAPRLARLALAVAREEGWQPRAADKVVFAVHRSGVRRSRARSRVLSYSASRMVAAMPS